MASGFANNTGPPVVRQTPRCICAKSDCERSNLGWDSAQSVDLMCGCRLWFAVICLSSFTFISTFTCLPHSSSYTPYPHLCPLLCHFGQRYHHHCRQGKCVEWCRYRSKRGSPRLNSSTTSPTGHCPVDSVHCKYYTEDSSPGLDNWVLFTLFPSELTMWWNG